MHGSPCTIVRAEVILHPARSNHLLANHAGLLTRGFLDLHLLRRSGELSLLKPLADFRVKGRLVIVGCIGVV